VLAAVKRSVDRDPAPGQFVLTGSVGAERGHATWAGPGRIVLMSMNPVYCGCTAIRSTIIL
jgi:hypothetical protein